MEVQATRIVRVAPAERARPVVAVRPRFAERAIVALACGGQENEVAFISSNLTCDFSAIDTVLSGPLGSRSDKCFNDVMKRADTEMYENKKMLKSL